MRRAFLALALFAAVAAPPALEASSPSPQLATIAALELPMPQGGDLGICLVYGAIVAVGVSCLKRLPLGIGKWIARNPKTCVAVLSAVTALAPLLRGSGMTIAELAACVAAQMGGSQLTYSYGLEPAGKAVGLAADKV